MGLKTRFMSASGTADILQIVHSLHRPVGQVEGEVDFVNYLAERGVPVPRAVSSTPGKLAENIPCGFI